MWYYWNSEDLWIFVQRDVISYPGCSDTQPLPPAWAGPRLSPPLASSPGGAQSAITASSDSRSTWLSLMFQVLSPDNRNITLINFKLYWTLKLIFILLPFYVNDLFIKCRIFKTHMDSSKSNAKDTGNGSWTLLVKNTITWGQGGTIPADAGQVPSFSPLQTFCNIFLSTDIRPDPAVQWRVRAASCWDWARLAARRIWINGEWDNDQDNIHLKLKQSYLSYFC